MTKTRFTPWVVLACIGTLAGCTSGEGGTAGNTELNVAIPTGGGSSAPADFDIQVVEYTINCDATPPIAADFPGIDTIEPTYNPDVTINGVLEVIDDEDVEAATNGQAFGPDLGEIYVWQGFMDIPKDALCTVQLRARDFDREVICTSTESFNTNSVAVGGVVKVNVLMYCGISFQAPVASLDLDGDFSFNIANFCPDLFVLNCIDTALDVRTISGVGEVAATACQVRARDGDSQCGNSCDEQTCVETAEGLTCTAAPEPMICSADSGNGEAGMPCTGQFMCNGLAENAGDLCTQESDCTPLAGTDPPVMCDSVQCELPGACVLRGPQTKVECQIPSFRCAAPPLFGVPFGTPCDPAAADLGNSDCGWPPPGTDLGGGNLAPPVCAPGAVMDCNGLPNDPSGGEPPFDTSCTYNGDVLGNIGDLAPAPLQPGPGGFFVQCLLGDDDGNPATDDVPVDPGAIVVCTATTTDGDTDCDKVKTIELTCPGLTGCQTFGGDVACNDSALPGATACRVGTCNESRCDGSDAAACCDYVNAADGTLCPGEGVDPPAECSGGVCESLDCNAQSDPDGSCDDLDECTIDTCDAPPATTCSNTVDEGANCAGGTGMCNAAGACIDNCDGESCVDEDIDGNPAPNPCTDDICTSGGNGFTCTNPPNDANSCDTCGEANCLCSGGTCIAGCTVPAPVDAPGIPMACRNSFNQVVSTFPIDLLNVTVTSTSDDCILSGETFNAAVDPTIALDTAFLQAAADTLCDLGTTLTAADVTVAQIRIDAVAGATCTSQLAELTPVPQEVALDVTVTGECGAGGSVRINSGVSLPLPAQTLPCTAGNADDEVQICSTGEVPLAIDLSATPTDTFVGVSVSGGAIEVVFQCNTSSTTVPPPGTVNEIGCAGAFPSTPDGQTCADAVGTGDTGETPFPTSSCLTDEKPSPVCVGGSNAGLPCAVATAATDCPGGTPVCTAGDNDAQACDPNGDIATECPGSDDAECSSCAPPRCLAFGTQDVQCTGTCATVPVTVDPSTVCATFTVQ